MPRRDGTGPQGLGAMTGRGAGVCGGARPLGNGAGRGLNCRRVGINAVTTDKDILTQQKTILEARLAEINNQLK